MTYVGQKAWTKIAGGIAATLALGVVGCFDPEVRVCNVVTSEECGTEESCSDPAFGRCPETDQTDVDASKACIQPGSERCVAMGTGKGGDACTKHADCSPAMFCIGVQVGACRQRCDHILGGCQKNETCVDLMPRFNTPDDAGYCLPPVCDPVKNTGCESGQVCFAGTTPICGLAGKKQVGETCENTSDCVQQSFCLSSTKKCTAACDTTKDIGAAAGCKQDETCKAVLSGGIALPGNVGHCVSPCDITTDQGCSEQGQCLKDRDNPPKCYKAGVTELGESCFGRGECVHGAHCIEDAVNFTKACARKCDPDLPDKAPCGSDLQCIKIQGYAVGYCGKGGGP